MHVRWINSGRRLIWVSRLIFVWNVLCVAFFRGVRRKYSTRTFGRLTHMLDAVQMQWPEYPKTNTHGAGRGWNASERRMIPGWGPPRSLLLTNVVWAFSNDHSSAESREHTEITHPHKKRTLASQAGSFGSNWTLTMIKWRQTPD